MISSIDDQGRLWSRRATGKVTHFTSKEEGHQSEKGWFLVVSSCFKIEIENEKTNNFTGCNWNFDPDS